MPTGERADEPLGFSWRFRDAVPRVWVGHAHPLTPKKWCRAAFNGLLRHCGLVGMGKVHLFSGPSQAPSPATTAMNEKDCPGTTSSLTDHIHHLGTYYTTLLSNQPGTSLFRSLAFLDRHRGFGGEVQRHHTLRAGASSPRPTTGSGKKRRMGLHLRQCSVMLVRPSVQST